MKNKEYAASKGLISLEQLQEERMAFLLCEGFDEAGREYPTLDAWLSRLAIKPSYEPVAGGRGIGDWGNG